jgi:multidrug efflux pump
MANFFINRPVFAWVIAIILMLAGALSITNLPVAQYPESAKKSGVKPPCALVPTFVVAT